MSGYLARLAVRAGGSARAVGAAALGSGPPGGARTVVAGPRVASRFEGLGQEDHRPGPGSAAGRGADSARQLDQGLGADLGPDVGERPAGDGGGVRDGDIPWRDRSAPRSAEEADAVGPRRPGSVRPRPAALARDAVGSASVPPPPSSRLGHADQARARDGWRRALTSGEAAADLANAQPAPGADGSPDSTLGGEPVLAGPGSPSRVVRASPVVGGEATRRSVAPDPSQRPGARPAGTTDGDRVVHVAIGRIDVRAAAPVPSTAPSAPSAPSDSAGREPAALSLGDYLRGRRDPR